ncbi:outer membrane lipoprotein-sorting protein [Aliivibrio kagoshimensis]|uniref:outer membrane lipoprotein-sorting protein n=1 Tax=Aliivibrio kagoshimensis TaxID=2910230 RepID=UPI003D1066B9
MYKLISRSVALLFISLLVISPTWASGSDSATHMLLKADRYRLLEGQSKVVSLVALYQNGELNKTRKYNVYTRPNRESLVIFKAKAEAGQKMLMLGDNYWLLMPKSRRPIRITPMQKLLGEASIGDISTLTWSDDYQGKVLLTEPVDDQPSVKLELIAKTKGASYRKIELWLHSDDYFPLKANLYLRSGKMAKQAWFQRGEREGKPAVTQMRLKDSIQPQKETVIDYLEVIEQGLDDKYYNPAFLSRNSVSGL